MIEELIEAFLNGFDEILNEPNTTILIILKTCTLNIHQ